jgi:hypothetical protein
VPFDLTVYIVETPLNDLINYLETASASLIDDKTRDTLNKAQDASNSLIDTMDNILKLAGAEDGSNHPKCEMFNLKLTGKAPNLQESPVLTYTSNKSFAGATKRCQKKRFQLDHINPRQIADLCQRQW